MIILGLNSYHGDAAACVVIDGRVAVAIEEERLRRIKHCAGFPSAAVRACLEWTGVRPSEIDHVAVGRRPSANLLGKLGYLMRSPPPLRLLRDRTANLGSLRQLKFTLARSLDLDPATLKAQVHYVEHHLAHAASSFYPSEFENAICVSLDGFGDFASTLWAVGRGSRIEVRRRVLFPHSLGVFYTAGTQFLGFANFGDEYKVMGLAPYGKPDLVGVLREFIPLGDHGGFTLALDAYRHTRHVIDTQWAEGPPGVAPYYADAWASRLGAPRRPDEAIIALHENVACSLQAVFEEVGLHVLRHAASLAPETTDLCLAGGCAFNSVLNGKIAKQTPFRRLAIHPAAGDAGTAVGAALWVWHERLGQPRHDPQEQAFLGPEFGDASIRSALANADLDYEWVATEADLTRAAARHLAAGDVLGWFQGRSEWGPRALGNRSILADPRRPEMPGLLNTKIKRREPFRPFAPAVLQDRVHDYFIDAQPAPFMNQVYPVRPEWRTRLPAVTHVDGTGRLQTVTASANPLFHALLERFAELTGVPVLLNTSFNENEPIVHTPAEAIACFKRTEIDCLVLGRAIVRRPERRSG